MSRRRESADARAFRDAVRDIIAAEGWFEVLVGSASAPAPGDARLYACFAPRPLATA